jgi:tRNA threonylcarbamoyladenosine modification (KEOPS) complex  Pcc1 subunit
MVLAALGLKAETFEDASKLFAEHGFVVASKRIGRAVEPEIILKSREGSSIGMELDANEWKIEYKSIDFSPVAQWMRK